jgi:DNA-binding GntR family transcriptional regulator
MVKEPRYLKIAAQLRGDIASGRFGPNAKLPSETQLMMRHGVSRSVAKWAIAVLKADGLVDGRQGAGVFVRAPRRAPREAHRHRPPDRPQAGPQPLVPSPAAGEVGRIDPWTYLAEEVSADVSIAERLAVIPGDPVLRTSSRYVAEEVPLQLVMSWQPSEALIGKGPDGPDADQLCERVIVRPASPIEIAALQLPARGSVLAIARTFTARGVPVETADIIIPSDRCELIYRLSIG